MIRVILKEKGEVTKALPRLSQRLRAALLQAMKEAAVLIQSLAKLNAPVFRGMLRVSIAQNVAEDGARIVGEVGSGLPYASVVEDGRNPWAGRQPPSGPGSDLRTWARRKLGDER
ncbi:MAG: HK97 gp10 family phage protein, partial [Elusimicrobiota bacterium]